MAPNAASLLVPTGQAIESEADDDWRSLVRSHGEYQCTEYEDSSFTSSAGDPFGGCCCYPIPTLVRKHELNLEIHSGAVSDSLVVPQISQIVPLTSQISSQLVVPQITLSQADSEQPSPSPSIVRPPSRSPSGTAAISPRAQRLASSARRGTRDDVVELNSVRAVPSSSTSMSAAATKKLLARVGLPSGLPFTMVDAGVTHFFTWYRAGTLDALLATAPAGHGGGAHGGHGGTV